MKDTYESVAGYTQPEAAPINRLHVAYVIIKQPLLGSNDLDQKYFGRNFHVLLMLSYGNQHERVIQCILFLGFISMAWHAQ